MEEHVPTNVYVRVCVWGGVHAPACTRDVLSDSESSACSLVAAGGSWWQLVGEKPSHLTTTLTVGTPGSSETEATREGQTAH